MNTLQKSLTRAFRVMILADTAFGSVSFLKGVRKRRLSAIVGVCGDRCLSDGRQLRHQRQQVYLKDLPFAVTIAWFYLKHDGKLQRRFVLSTRPLKRSILIWWGKRRWAIEGFFKTAKHRFGLERFGQGALRGVYRWLDICLIAFLLAHWVYLATHPSTLPNWGLTAELALNTLFLIPSSLGLSPATSVGANASITRLLRFRCSNSLPHMTRTNVLVQDRN